MHLLSPPGSRSNIVPRKHHDGIPLGSSSKRGKLKIKIKFASTNRKDPVVEVRSLSFHVEYIEPADSITIYIYKAV
jgi:hypothetical protein